jgi:hypothetical protein
MKIFRNNKVIMMLMIAVLLFAFGTANVFAGTAAPKQKNIILATTTSTQDTGLLDVLIPIFEKQTGYFVKTIAVGSGQAMAMGQKGEADVLLVHSPDAEKKFVEEGYGIKRQLVMHNDFIIVGPAAETDCQSGRVVFITRRQFGNERERKNIMEKSRHNSRRTEVVSGNRIGHGTDFECCRGEKRLHADRSGNIFGS